ncbi:endonuclease V [Candidatus Bathyarchaeota archaeon]|nr:endonuclease V [Candidatus Bathyarchaeota archaeon]MBS7612880.1 endonuclease V [Candidatus Bathyarchaeota archaeon]MBS7617176.1 endonuclease V [Candidatus Bathyarchaeota archaeon]
MAEFNEKLIERLRKVQRTIALKAVIEDRFEKPICRIAGADIAYNGLNAYVAVVVLKLSDFRVIEKVAYRGKAAIPYIPSLLCFREGPLILRALRNVREEFQVLMVGGHGIAHPFKCGLATYVGVLSGRPSIGVSRRLLAGCTCEAPKGPLEHKPILLNGEVVGYCLKPRNRANPVYVSPGSFISLETTLEVSIRSLGYYRIPEPLRLAHLAANDAKKLHVFE